VGREEECDVKMWKKKCRTCGQWKPVSWFSKQTRGKYGVRAICKSCQREECREWRKRNKAYANEYSRNYYDQHGEEIRRRSVEYRAAHGDEYRERWLRWKSDNPRAGAAHSAARNALQRGLLVRLPCAFCGALPSVAHHEDHEKQLDVVWLCHRHHRMRHHGSLDILPQYQLMEV
jgi:hypothetical protein